MTSPVRFSCLKNEQCSFGRMRKSVSVGIKPLYKRGEVGGRTYPGSVSPMSPNILKAIQRYSMLSEGQCDTVYPSFLLSSSVKSKVHLAQACYSTVLNTATEINITSAARVKLMIYCTATPRHRQTIFTFICSAFSFKNGGKLQTSGEHRGLQGSGPPRRNKPCPRAPTWARQPWRPPRSALRRAGRGEERSQPAWLRSQRLP